MQQNRSKFAIVNTVTTKFFIFGLARLTRICNPSTDSEASLKIILRDCWKFSQESKWN